MSELIDGFLKSMDKFFIKSAEKGFKEAINMKISSISFSMILYNLYYTVFEEKKDIVYNVIESAVLSVEEAIKSQMTLESLLDCDNTGILGSVSDEEGKKLFEESKKLFMKTVSEERIKYTQIFKSEFDTIFELLERAKEICKSDD